MLKEATVLAQLIQSYARAGNLRKGRQIHARLLTSNGPPSTFLSNHLLNMYSKCDRIPDARHLFDQMPQRNLVSWTSMITAFSHNSLFIDSLLAFSRLHSSSGIRPTQFAFSSAIQAAASLPSLPAGTQLHSLSLKLGYHSDLFVGSNLADMYSKCGSPAASLAAFDEMPEKDEVSWTAAIDARAKSGDFDAALSIFRGVLRDERLAADQHLLCAALAASAATRAGDLGQSIHARVLKLGFSSEIAIINSLTNMYSKTGDPGSAVNLISSSPDGWNVISCSALIDGYAESGRTEEAVAAYVKSCRRGIGPNEFTFSTLFKACAGNAALDQGTQLHAQAIKAGFILDSFVSAVLVDMYGKCGLLSSSTQVFGEAQNPTVISWNSLINALAQHGRGRDAIDAFEQMIERGFKPNQATFVSLLVACSHSVLVEQGLQFFHSMKGGFGIEPRDEHYSCVIDMLGRAGRLREAEEFIGRMPVEPNAFAWCSLLGACRNHGRWKELGETAAEKLMRLDPGDGGAHVLLSSIYAGEGRWEEVKAVRMVMRDSGRKKLPGLSWVEVGKKTHVFGSEDWSHPLKDEIYMKMEELWVRIREEGYVPYTAAVVSRVEESEKERLLRNHSERIAVAFALLRSPKEKMIIVKKNLRICVDCHSAFKLIAKVEGRAIVVRDSSRFHHFQDGSCSCGDQW